MDTFLSVVISAAVLGIALLISVRKTIILEYQRGLLYRNGKFVSTLQPGQHFYLSFGTTVQRIDVRKQFVVMSGQEVLTSDNVGIKISLVASYAVTDPYQAVNQVANFTEALHLMLQLNLRDAVGALAVDDLLAKRAEVGQLIFDRSKQQANELGLELLLVNIRDIMFPGELKNIFAQVVNARKEGLAALERARGESAALRNLANAAQLLEEHPALRQLRLLQALEGKSGNTIVLLGNEFSSLNNSVARPQASEQKK